MVAVALKGTENQIEWAERIRLEVNREFDRVESAFRSIAEKQTGGKFDDTHAIIGILADKRADVMSRDSAGYFIHDWQEMGDQVRQMIFQDPRYQEIKTNRAR